MGFASNPILILAPSVLSTPPHKTVPCSRLTHRGYIALAHAASPYGPSALAELGPAGGTQRLQLMTRHLPEERANQSLPAPRLQEALQSSSPPRLFPWPSLRLPPDRRLP